MTVAPRPGTSAAIAVFVALAVSHLLALAAGWASVSEWTKPFLLPALGIAVVSAAVASAAGIRRSRPVRLLLLAQAASCVGDIALLGDGDGALMFGLSAFLIAHVVYIVIFSGSTGNGNPRPWSVGYLIWLAALLALLMPHLGALGVPVVGYGIVIALMAITATRCTPRIIVGATLFLISDSLLAVNRFVPDANLWQPDVLIMLTYLAGQAFLAWGIVSGSDPVRSRFLETGAA